jgi:hypothetical protein
MEEIQKDCQTGKVGNLYSEPSQAFDPSIHLQKSSIVMDSPEIIAMT